MLLKGGMHLFTHELHNINSIPKVYKKTGTLRMFEKGLIYHKIINVDLFYLFAVYIVLMIVRLLMSINRIHLEIVCVWGNCISYSDYTDNTIFYDF